MAPKKGTKRQSSVSKGGVQKKLKAAYAIVADALVKATWIPGSHDAFIASVASSLGVHKDERHQDQQAMVDMIGAGLEERRAALQAKVDEAKADVDNAPTEKENRAKALDDATVALAALEQAVEDKKAALTEATAAEGEKKKALQEKNDNAKTGDKMLDAISDMKVKLELMQVAFAMGGQGKISGRSPAVKVPRTFVNIGKELGLEMQMLSTLPDILAKEPEKRSEFEHFAVDKFGESLAKLAEVYGESALKAQEASKTERAEAVVAAQEDLTNASDSKTAGNTALTEARAAVRAGKQEVERAQKVVDNYVMDMKVLMDKYDVVKEDIAVFTEGPLSTFDDMKDKVMPDEAPDELAAPGINVN